MAKPTLTDLFDEVLAHRNRVNRIARQARIVDQPEFEREAIEDLRSRFAAWGIDDAFDWSKP